MAILKTKDIEKMELKERNEKIAELKVELIKAKLGNKKASNQNPKEIKKTIARILTLNNTKANKLMEETNNK